MPETTGNNSAAYKLLNDTNRRICYDGSVCAMCRDCFSENYAIVSDSGRVTSSAEFNTLLLSSVRAYDFYL